MSSTTELKALQGKIDVLSGQIKTIKYEQSLLSEKVNDLEGQRRGILSQIDKLKVKDIIVSEHALLRYLERHYDVDLEELKKLILTEDMRQKIDTYGSGKFPHPDGFRCVVKDRTVVTIESKDMK